MAGVHALTTPPDPPFTRGEKCLRKYHFPPLQRGGPGPRRGGSEGWGAGGWTGPDEPAVVRALSGACSCTDHHRCPRPLGCGARDRLIRSGLRTLVVETQDRSVRRLTMGAKIVLAAWLALAS